MLDVRQLGDRVLVALRVRPRSRPGLSLGDGGLVLSVTAPPEKGRATDEARRSLAQALDVPPSAVELRTGASARRKVFVVSGLGSAEVRARLLRAATG